jgi:uncharacterized repeat protein (TIGR03806 family)
MRFLLVVALAFVACSQKKQPDIVSAEEVVEENLSGLGRPTLSAYGFFTGPLRNLEPAKGVVPYSINAALFSDYAFKKRFIQIPDGSQIVYNGREVFDFPDGAVLIKNFYYPADFNRPEENLRIIETRLLILENGSWKVLPYVWNDEQTEAFLEVAGSGKSVSWKESDGTIRSIEYSIPNVNQCKGCHLKGEKVMPIGLSARQLNLGKSSNQLAVWQEQGILTGMPELKTLPRITPYEDESESLSDRARAWLEINCAHCHRPDGQAKTSGLHLMANVSSPHELGIGKAPVAAGKGSGGLRFDIVPAHPEESILLFRITSTDPGIMMPEMGRKLVHKEGVDLIRRWILEMKP